MTFEMYSFTEKHDGNWYLSLWLEAMLILFLEVSHMILILMNWLYNFELYFSKLSIIFNYKWFMLYT